MEREFKIGDEVIFKSHSECGGGYRFDGCDMGGEKGTIVRLEEDDTMVHVQLETPPPDYKSIWRMKVYELQHAKVYELQHLNPSSPKTKTKLNFNY